MERKGSSVFTWTGDAVVMKTLMLNPMRGTGTKGGWIWVIIARDGTVNPLMGGLIIYSTKVAEATSYGQVRAQARVLSLDGDLRRGGGTIVREESKVE